MLEFIIHSRYHGLCRLLLQNHWKNLLYLGKNFLIISRKVNLLSQSINQRVTQFDAFISTYLYCSHRVSGETTEIMILIIQMSPNIADHIQLYEQKTQPMYMF